MRVFTVLDIKDVRLDKYLALKLKWSRSQIQKLIDQGKVLVNNKRGTSNYQIKINDLIKVNPKLGNLVNLKISKIKLDICYEDDYLLVINKPKGMVVHPSLAHHQDTVANALLYHCSKLSNVKGEFRPGIVHRLDKDTSGLLVVAKDNDTHLNLVHQLKTNQFKRIYLALVHGNISHLRGTIDAPLGRSLTDYKKMAVTEVNSKEAITHFRVLKSLLKATLIECQLETGRTHQIRVHFQYINHPLVNDSFYSDRPVIDQSGQMLHAKKIIFIHPLTGKKMKFEVDPPASFMRIVSSFNN